MQAARTTIFSRYAKQLGAADLNTLAALTEGLSGRDILDVCRLAERRWASVVLRSGLRAGDQGAPSASLPMPLSPLAEYEAAIGRRQAV